MAFPVLQPQGCLAGAECGLGWLCCCSGNFPYLGKMSVQFVKFKAGPVVLGDCQCRDMVTCGGVTPEWSQAGAEPLQCEH